MRRGATNLWHATVFYARRYRITSSIQRQRWRSILALDGFSMRAAIALLFFCALKPGRIPIADDMLNLTLRRINKPKALLLLDNMMAAHCIVVA